MYSINIKLLSLLALCLLYREGSTVAAFQTGLSDRLQHYNRITTRLAATKEEKEATRLSEPILKGYETKWVKKSTLADNDKDVPLSDKGIQGTVAVVFKQGNATKTTLAQPGELLRNVASQAGQFIKYGCGKGECGTCECLINGKWIRPCTATVPGNVAPGQEFVVVVKDVKNKARSSGKFYSFKSFIMGFYNNLIGMVGFVKYRRNAKKNWQERQEYEELVRQKTLEKKRLRAKQQQQHNGGDLKP